MRNAMITIEILISILILFLVIATSVSMIKQLRMIEEKEKKIETLYVDFHNLYNYLDDTICYPEHIQMQGKLSNVIYTAHCKLIEQRRNYENGDEDTVGGNIGSYLFSLYEVTLNVVDNDINKTYQYYKTVTENI